MEIQDVELYLAKDIIQGESVPFYITWKRDDVKILRDILFWF